MSGITANRSLAQLLAATLFLLILPLALISLVALEGYERHLVPELRNKADTVGRALVRRVERAMELGIPVDQLVGMDEFMGQLIAGNDDIAFVALARSDGPVLHASGIGPQQAEALVTHEAQTRVESGGTIAALRQHVSNFVDRITTGTDTVERLQDNIRGGFLITTLPVMDDGREVGALHVGVPLRFLAQQLEDIAFDIVIVLLVGLLVAFELLLLVVSTNLSHPLSVARDLMRDVRAGRFPRLGTRPDQGEVTGLVGALASAVDRVNDWHARLRRHLAERRGRPPEAERTLEEIEQRYVFDQTPAESASRRENLVAIRILTFLFMVAEELARPFLPVFIEGFAQDVTFGDPSMLTSLPLAAFMLVAALTMGIGGPIADRLERRHAFAIGALISTVGLFGTAFSQGYVDLLLWRMLSGVGYGLAFIAVQGYIIDHTGESNRAQGVAMFVGAIMAADICGPAIGGILADRVGFEATLMIGAAAALLSALLVGSLMRARTGYGAGHVVHGSFAAGFVAVARNWRFWVLVVFAALPAKFVLTGFLYFQVPLFLTAIGSTQSEIGRVLMLYGIVALIGMPFFAYWADRLKAHGFMVGFGSTLAGIGLLPILFDASFLRVVIAVLCLGLGQAMSISSLLAVVTRITRVEVQRYGQASVLGTFRLIERLGSAIGPVVVALLVARYGHAVAMAATGLVVVASSLLFSVLMLMGGYEPEAEGEIVGAAVLADDRAGD